MIKIKSKKIHNSPDNKSFTYYLTFENDPIEYELNYNYSNSCFYKGITATLSIVSNNFCKAISSKRLKFIKRFSIKQVHDVFNEYSLNKPNDIDLEHIAECIKQGYDNGQLIQEDQEQDNEE